MATIVICGLAAKPPQCKDVKKQVKKLENSLRSEIEHVYQANEENAKKLAEAIDEILSLLRRHMQTPSTNTTTTPTTTTPTTTTPTTTNIPTTTTTTPLSYVIRLPNAPYSVWSVKTGKVDAIDFVPNQDIFITGVSLLGSNDGSQSHQGVMKILEQSTKKVLSSKYFNFNADGTNAYFDQYFDNASSLKSGNKYTITVEYTTSYYTIYRASGGVATTTATCQKSTVTFVFSDSDDDNNNSGVTAGQIPRIMFTC